MSASVQGAWPGVAGAVDAGMRFVVGACTRSGASRWVEWPAPRMLAMVGMSGTRERTVSVCHAAGISP
jgi:hypothetical protein